MRSPRIPAGLCRTLTTCAAMVLMRASSVVAAAAGDAPIGPHTFEPAITAADFAAHVQVLSSDAFAGRAPDTEGEERTVHYLVAMLTQLGLQPGNKGSFVQAVPVVASTLDAQRSRVEWTSPKGERSLRVGEDLIVASGAGRAEVSIADSPLVFAGYGIVAPERNRDDYARFDMHGKTAVVLIGAPDSFPAVTYYARAGYKAEEAARHGAAAVLIIHDKTDSGYDWSYLAARGNGVQFDLRPSDDPQPTPPLRGWISAAAARDLFAQAELRMEDARAAAGERTFSSRPLGDVRLRADLHASVVEGQSRNIVAMLPGATFPDEAVVYSAHWDHLGTHAARSGPQVFHGAVDNATGVAAVLELAARFVAEANRPARSIVFLLPTLEESGLLGSKYYTAHPVVALADTVADLNFDAMVPVGPARDYVIVGPGMSELDEWIRPLVVRHQRSLAGEGRQDKDNFFRSDHLSFARAGVPVLFLRGGTRSTQGRGDPYALWNAYGRERYHTPDDRFDAGWDLRGIVEDVDIAYDLGRKLADSREWPDYRSDNGFRPLRDALRPKAGEPAPAAAH